MRVRELAQRLGLTFEGDGEKTISGAAELERAGTEDVAFVGSKKFWKLAEASAAGCLIVTFDYPSMDRTMIRAAEPRAAFAGSLMFLYPKANPQPGVAPTAAIDPSVSLGDQVSIAPHTTIGAVSKLGDRVQIHAGCCIGRNVKIGKD